MDFVLPKNCQVEKFIPKNKFYTKTRISTKLKDEFTDSIAKIIWKYKLSPETLSIPKTQRVSEIQIFEIQLKEKVIPKNVLQLIDRLIPYPILYFFRYNDYFAYGIRLKDELSKNYYFSEWNEVVEFNFNAIDLERVYHNIVSAFIKSVDTRKRDFKEIIENDQQITILGKEIQTLKNKIKQEKQFNKKVELNTLLQQKQKLLQNIR